MEHKQSKKTSVESAVESPRVAAVKRILSITKLVRQRGTPEQAEEAVAWEKQLQQRLNQLEAA